MNEVGAVAVVANNLRVVGDVEGLAWNLLHLGAALDQLGNQEITKRQFKRAGVGWKRHVQLGAWRNASLVQGAKGLGHHIARQQIPVTG